jgi:glucosamine 6-phosphate synthetase-like amidotransferase/phosphosugar isomerase protein
MTLPSDSSLPPSPGAEITESATQPITQMWLNIGQQPESVRRSLDLDLALPPAWFDLQHLRILGCGTSHHAGLVARYWFEAWTEIETEVLDAAQVGDGLRAAELRSLRRSPAGLILLSQSGRTTDVLQSLAAAIARGSSSPPFTLGITNGSGTALHALAHHTLQTPAGEERAVAATKSFTAQLVLLLRLALSRATRLSADSGLTQQIQALPQTLQTLILDLTGPDSPLQAACQALAQAPSCVLLGRGIQYPMAREGALKLKETAYLHAEGLAAGDFMHGPVAIVQPGFVVIALAPSARTGRALTGAAHSPGAMAANIARVKACGAYVIGIGDRPSPDFDVWLPIPTLDAALSPLLTALPLQLLAHETARLKGLEIDAPRHLTKFIG